MRKIVLLSLTDHTSPVAVINYVDIIRDVVRRPLDQQRGADIVELRKGIRILDAIERSNEVLELEDSDWEHLREKVLAMQWNVVDERIVKFVDDVLAATDRNPLYIPEEPVENSVEHQKVGA